MREYETCHSEVNPRVVRADMALTEAVEPEGAPGYDSVRQNWG